MKKYFTFALVLGTILTGCSGNTFDSSSEDLSSLPPVSSSEGGETSMPVENTEIKKIWHESYNDPAHGFNDLLDIDSANFLRNGEYLSTFPDELRANADNKFEFYNKTRSHVRYIDKSNGFGITFPLLNETFNVDYSLAKYRLHVDIGDAQLNITMENNAYSGDPHGYNIYVTEWFDRYINNPKYLEDNNLRKFKPIIYRSESVLSGYEVTIWNIAINDAKKFDRPYYSIILIRELGQYNKVLVMNVKSNKDESDLIYDLITSYKTVTAKGTPKNYFEPALESINPKWNEATKAYYQKLLEREKVEWGMFTKSMPSDDSPYFPTNDKQLGEFQDRFENEFGYEWGIMPTYTHIGWYNELNYFPNILAKKYADGDGFNGKPVLQFTYQFTTNNNYVTPSNTSNLYTPMFDIIRGKFDDHFRKLARDIKAYQKPVLFRLNNEMNTDWTSYCGMMTLNDPEIFNLTWKYLYNIFEEEGVDNAIWIWNPAHVSTPYSNWGEDLAYYPGHEYVHVLGLTHYEMNNGNGQIQSFRDMYTSVFNKNNVTFGAMPWIISEFACGSGGDSDGLELYRNENSQAAWIKGMLEDWANREDHPYVQKIVGAVWFSCHDYAGDLIVNALAIDPPLAQTIAAFNEGFAKVKLSEQN